MYCDVTAATCTSAPGSAGAMNRALHRARSQATVAFAATVLSYAQSRRHSERQYRRHSSFSSLQHVAILTIGIPPLPRRADMARHACGRRLNFRLSSAKLNGVRRMEGGARDPGRPRGLRITTPAPRKCVWAVREFRARPGSLLGRYGTSRMAACERFAKGQTRRARQACRLAARLPRCNDAPRRFDSRRAAAPEAEPASSAVAPGSSSSIQ